MWIFNETPVLPINTGIFIKKNFVFAEKNNKNVIFCKNKEKFDVKLNKKIFFGQNNDWGCILSIIYINCVLIEKIRKI